MKRFLLPVALFLVQSSFAQITLSLSDFAVVGDSILIAVDTLPTGVSVGGTGLQTWDFTSLQVESSSINRFKDPVSTPNGSYFPASNLAYESSTNTTYIKAQASKVEILGANVQFATNTFIPILSNDPQLVLEFPANFNDQYLDTTYFVKAVKLSDITTPNSLVDSVKLIHYGYSTHNIDAHGLLSLPGNTFNTLRKKRMEISYDTFYYKGLITSYQWALVPANAVPQIPQNPVKDTSYSYEWYANNQKFTILSVDADINDNILKATYLYQNALAVSITPTNVSCFNGNDGTADVNHLSIGLGTPPYTYTWSNGQNTKMTTGLSVGTYFVTVQDAASNTTTASIVITQPNDISQTSVLTHPQTASSAEGSISLVVSGGTAPYTYQWNNNPSTNDTIKNLTAGTYSVTVTDAKACTKNFSFALTAWPTAIENISDVEAISIYPNPANDKLFIENVDQISLYNLLGETVLVKKFNTKTLNSLNISNLNEGVYFVSYKTSDNKSISKKIIISR